MHRPRSTLAVLSALLLGTVAAAPGALAQDAAPGVIDVTAVEYAFVGLPSSLPVGTSFRLVNGGQEDHEFFIVRRNEGTTESLEELLSLPPDATAGKVTLVGGVAAETGQTTPGALTVLEPGQYIVACFITQGTVNGVSPSPAPGASPEEAGGTPHALLGMVGEFTVGGPDTSPGPVSTPVG